MTMGIATQLGKKSRWAFTPLRTAVVLGIVVVCLMWSMVALDMSPVTVILKDKAQGVITEAQNNAAKADAITSPSQSAPPPITNPVASDRPLILYAYADSKDGSALENLKFFIAHGLHAAADFVFIFNGETEAENLIPEKENIRSVLRSNTCYDLGAYAEVLLKKDLYKKYKRFIMMNASIRGPFVPYWSEGCWSDMFLGKVTEDVKLVGMTANCWPTFHIQSMIWATDLVGITTLLFPPQKALTYLSTHPITLLPGSTNSNTTPQPPGINGCFDSWNSAVAAEISSTSLILAAGYKVDAMMSAYHGSAEYEEAKSCGANRDVLWEKGYFGIDVHPFETVFLKANRDVAPLTLQRHSEWVKARGYSSYDYCRI